MRQSESQNVFRMFPKKLHPQFSVCICPVCARRFRVQFIFHDMDLDTKWANYFTIFLFYPLPNNQLNDSDIVMYSRFSFLITKRSTPKFWCSDEWCFDSLRFWQMRISEMITALKHPTDETVLLFNGFFIQYNWSS